MKTRRIDLIKNDLFTTHPPTRLGHLFSFTTLPPIHLSLSPFKMAPKTSPTATAKKPAAAAAASKPSGRDMIAQAIKTLVRTEWMEGGLFGREGRWMDWLAGWLAVWLPSIPTLSSHRSAECFPVCLDCPVLTPFLYCFFIERTLWIFALRCEEVHQCQLQGERGEWLEVGQRRG